jgi:multiple sugar transport system ATP-binding protein
MASIRLENVTVRFEHHDVLKGIDLTVDDGELCALVGPSGCGKTLVLRVIAGLTQPAQGNVYMDGQLVNNVPPGGRDIAMVFQRFALYPYMTTRENWAFPLIAARLPHEEVVARVNVMSEFLSMGLLMDRYPKQLSGGQQQRVAVGRALVRRAKVFLMDEPLGSQDAKMRVEMRAKLKKLQMDLGITTVYVTHDQVEAQAIGDKVAVMEEGTIHQVGSPEEIYDKPATLFVAGFVGTPRMNFLDGTLHREGGQLYVRHPRFRLAVPPAEAQSIEAGASSQEVVMGFRPEHIKLSQTAEADSIPTEVYVLEPQSNKLVVSLKFGEDILKMQADRDRLTFEPQLGQQVFMIFEQEFAHVFDKTTGRRIGS